MSLDLYHTLLDLAITQPNIDLLVKVWHDSVTLDKKDMIELNERILHAIPKLRKKLSLPGDPKDFKKFIEDYDEQQYTQQCSNIPNECLKFFSKKGDWRNVRKAIEKGADNWILGLQGAAEGGWKDLVDFFWEKLEEKNPSHELQKLYANTGLEAAARGGHFNLVKFFLEKGAKKIISGLANASRGGHLELVKFLIEKGANNMNLGLANAARGGHLDLIKFFISKGAKDWNTPMKYAARGGHINLVKFFEKKGGSNWEGVLTEAAKGGHLDIVKLAVERGAKDWKRALRYAVIKDRLEVAKYLISIHEEDKHLLFELLVTASSKGYEDVVEFLFTILPPEDPIESRVNSNTFVEGKSASTNLDAAIFVSTKDKHFEFFKHLLEKEGRTLELDTLLARAANNGSLKIVEYLVEHGAENFNVALRLAAEGNHLDVVKYLVEQGATELEEALKSVRIAMEDDDLGDDDRSEVIDYLEEQIRR